MRNIFAVIFCGAETSINALGVEHIISWDSFSIFLYFVKKEGFLK